MQRFTLRHGCFNRESFQLNSEATTEFKEGAGPGLLWWGVLAPPLTMLIQMQINYSLVLWACAAGRTWAIHLVFILALGITILSGLLSFRNWRLAGAQWEADGAGVLPRSRFMAVVGILISGLITLVLIAQWIPVFVYGPCQR
jgi:hypothetical protein